MQTNASAEDTQNFRGPTEQQKRASLTPGLYVGQSGGGPTLSSLDVARCSGRPTSDYARM